LSRAGQFPISRRENAGAPLRAHHGAQEFAMREFANRTRVPGLVSSWIFIASAIASATLARAAGDFPYVAYVVESDAYVRSGPGREHYPTGQLPAGYAVEVYRHDGAGWCAIRPPEGSFSLAPLRQLRMADERTAEVVADGVVARVGSSLGNQHSAVQVMLARGERVALLEPPSPTNPWVRVAPPAGEFRWIAARRLSRTPPLETPSSSNSAGWQSHSLARANTSPGVTGEGADELAFGAGDPFAHLRAQGQATPTTPTPVLVAAAPRFEPQTSSVAPASAVVNAGGGADDVQIIAGSPAAVRQAQYQEPIADAAAALPLANDPAAAPLSTPPRVRFEGLSARGPHDPRVAEMELRLSEIVIGPPGGWQFGGLREETAAMLAQEQAPEVRGQLRDLLDRIITFETIQQRRFPAAAGAQLAAHPAGTLGATSATQLPAPPATVAPGETSEILARVRADLGRVADNGVTPTPGGPTAPATESLYDAVGTLKPVVSKRQGAPQFALIDDHGDVVTFVTASPEVNLQAYIGQRIGIRGNRGFMPEYRRAHVTASRITPLEQTMVK
jgi:hypothetical protein